MNRLFLIFMTFVLSTQSFAHGLHMTKALLETEGDQHQLSTSLNLYSLLLDKPNHEIEEDEVKNIRLEQSEELLRKKLSSLLTFRSIDGEDLLQEIDFDYEGTDQNITPLTFYLSATLPVVISTKTDFGNIVVEYDGQPVLIPAGTNEKFGTEVKKAESTVLKYIILGFEHILPKGLDHILFVLALFLLSTSFKPLIIQVSAFTLAHTITLGISTLGIFSLPGSIVEPIIAFSIAFMAIENIMTQKLSRFRTALVFFFGLLHGLGFAGVLQELGLPKGQEVISLLSFNFGVELGQLAVVLIAYALLFKTLKQEWYHKRVVTPISAIIAIIGLYWTIERVFF